MIYLGGEKVDFGRNDFSLPCGYLRAERSGERQFVAD